MPTVRADKRTANQLRRVRLQRGFLKFAEHSCLVEWGDTKLVCSATVEERVPPFLKGTGTGWVTAEYGMLPRSSSQRIEREGRRGRVGGRTQEIQRLIGRSLRSIVRLDQMGERTVLLDCDVLQADGGTRCAAVTGSFVVLADAVRRLVRSGTLSSAPLKDFVAAVSVGIVKGGAVLDLNYAEDSTAEVDMNVVMTGSGSFVEVQGTAEGQPFGKPDLARMLRLAEQGTRRLIALQKKALGITALSKL